MSTRHDETKHEEGCLKAQNCSAYCDSTCKNKHARGEDWDEVLYELVTRR